MEIPLQPVVSGSRPPVSRDKPPARRAFLLPLIASLMALGGCVGSPFSTAIRQAAKNQPSLTELRTQPQAFLGRTVILGGTIVETTNLPNTTEIEVLEKPLGRYDDRPEETDRSAGRFLVRCPGFLDSAIYAKGREVTAAGPLEKPVTRPLGQVQYNYPVMGCQGIHLWPNRPPEPYNYPPPYWYGPYWRGWGFYPYWYPYYW